MPKIPVVTIPQAFQSAVQHHQAGRLAEAEALYRQVLSLQPDHAQAMHYLGVLAHQIGRHGVAVDLIRKSLAIHPNSAAAHSHLGEVCRVLGRSDTAIAHFRRALEIHPTYEAASYNLGNALQDQGRLDEAISAYRRAIELKPGYPQAHNNLGNALRDQGHPDEAIAAYRRALQINPNLPEIHVNLSNVLRDQKQHDEAIAGYGRALQLKPDFAAAHNNLGVALAAQSRLEEAIAAHRRAIQLNASYPEAHKDLADALRSRGCIEEAIIAYRHAIHLKPSYPEAYTNLANALRDRFQFDEAIEACRHALDLRPSFPEAYCTLAASFAGQGKLDEAISAFRSALRLRPEDAKARSNLIYTLHFHPGYNRAAIIEEQRQWNREIGDSRKDLIDPHPNDRSLDRPLRIGYVSPDFRNHVVGRNLLPLFERHDRQNFELFCYSGVEHPDDLTEEFRRRTQHWRSTLGIEDAALAEMIRIDCVDILVDLTQHMAGNRLTLFARRPAPVQVSFAGYPESTGLDAIEYRISDRHLEKASLEDGMLPREQVHLLDSFWCYTPCNADLEISELPALKNGVVTFGCLNNFCKVSTSTLRLWSQILGKVAGSRLVLLAGIGNHRQRTIETLESEGIDARRVEFVEQRPLREYLELYQRLDVILDTSPYNGHTTSLDALWMGVPVVSLAGKTPVSRAGLSQLTNLGLSELIAHSEAEYVSIATSLASDTPSLVALRSSLRARMENSPLMDSLQFPRNIEAAYRSFWQSWSSKEASTSHA